MDHSGSPIKGYILAAVLCATAGGITVAIATRAIPRIMSRMMSNMMENMIMRMGGKSCNPEEM